MTGLYIKIREADVFCLVLTLLSKYGSIILYIYTISQGYFYDRIYKKASFCLDIVTVGHRAFGNIADAPAQR